MDLTPFKECLAHKQSVYISNDDAPYKPCCWFRTGINASSFQEYKDKLADLDIETNCAHCIKQESSGAEWSHRKLFDNPKEFVLGVCFDNICNLKCVTCGPIHSSQLIGEWEELNLFRGKYDKKFYTHVSKQAPNKIEFVKDVLANSTFDRLRLEIFGGEPLINPNIFKFIDWVSEQPFAKSTMLSITSNGTTYTEKIEEYAKKFQFMSLQLSIDGISDMFEYLRYGTDYNETYKIINQYYELWDKYPNFTLGMNYTLSWMNSLHFVEFYNWAQTNFPKLHLHLTKLEGPAWYSVNILSMIQREKIVEYTDANAQVPLTPPFEKIMSLYKQSMLFKNSDEFDSGMYAKGLLSLHNIDKIRNEDYNHPLSEILEFIKNDTIRKSQEQ
jgi:organic radical activating enzyme